MLFEQENDFLDCFDHYIGLQKVIFRYAEVEDTWTPDHDRLPRFPW